MENPYVAPYSSLFQSHMRFYTMGGWHGFADSSETQCDVEAKSNNVPHGGTHLDNQLHHINTTTHIHQSPQLCRFSLSIWPFIHMGSKFVWFSPSSSPPPTPHLTHYAVLLIFLLLLSFDGSNKILIDKHIYICIYIKWHKTKQNKNSNKNLKTHSPSPTCWCIPFLSTLEWYSTSQLVHLNKFWRVRRKWCNVVSIFIYQHEKEQEGCWGKAKGDE